MQLKEFLKEIENAKLIGNGEIEIENLFMDSRQKNANGLFFCLVGEKVNGHDCVNQAIENGAVAFVCEKELNANVPQIIVEDTRLALGVFSSQFFGNPTKDMKVIGITGTNGKTTSTYMLSAIIEKSGKKVGTIGTLGAFYDGIKREVELTTPDPIRLQEILADMRNHGVEYVVMEVSAHALYYKKTAGISFSACIFTNLSQDHLDFFHTMDEYKRAKLALFLEKVCPLAIVNGDEETGREIANLRGDIKTVFYGLQTPVDAFAVITDERVCGSECMLNINDKLCKVSLALAGKHNVYNALAAATCALELGFSVLDIAEGLSGLKSVEGRLERFATYKGAEIFIDFAHTPDGLGKCIDALKPHCRGRMVCLFGCGGNRDKEKRPLMGEIAAKKADFCVLTSDNPRYEDPLDILSEIEKGYRRFSVKYVVVPDRKKGIEYALSFLKRGDILLIAGKGAEEYQEIMGIKYPFKDHDIVEKIIQKTDKL